jgi:hypothetical protein
MLSSRLAGIPISLSIIDEAGVPQLLDLQGANGKAVTVPSGRFKSESWPASNQSPAGLRRNSHPDGCGSPFANWRLCGSIAATLNGD